MKKILLSLLLTTAAFSQKSPVFFPGGTYDTSVAAPESVLGYQIGDRFTDYQSLGAVFEKLVATSNRIRRVEYGVTNEHRKLQAFIIGSPVVLARLDEIRKANLRLTDPRSIGSSQEAEKIISGLPVIVYLSYGVHGSEASSPEASMAVAYQLCAGTDSRTRAILENSIIIIDPNVNPDGHERYVQWVNSVLGAAPNLNPSSLEHSEPWPGGRTNHFFFDLNRDLSWQTQQETRARVQFYRSWMPHVHVDYHEMGYSGTYFFFPAAVPFHESLPPEVVKWGKIFGKGNADAFDKLGLPYYVGEEFDMFYPGYGDSWPTFNGSIGMTYEQAGGSRAALAVRKQNGQVLTLRERARDHFVTSIATLETAVKNRKERIDDFYRYWVTAPESAGPVKGYILSNAEDPGRSAEVAAILLRQGIEVHQLLEPAILETQPYYSKKWTREKFEAGTFFIPTNQPQARLARALLEPVTAARDTFFYDISAWSLPVASGLKAWTSHSPLPPGTRQLLAVTLPAGSVVGEKNVYAYLIPWERHNAGRVAWQLLERGYSLSVAHRPFETLGKHFVAGTVIAFTGANPETLSSDVAALANELGVDVYATSTGLTDNGISLGSSHVEPIRKSNIAIAVGPPVSSGDYGELWFLFEQVLHIPFTGIRATELADADLTKFNVIILPDGGNYQSVFDSARVDKLKKWVQGGGVLIGIEGGAQFLTKSKSGISQATIRSEKKEDEKSKEEKDLEKSRKEIAKRQTLFEKEESDRLSELPGTIFRALVDTTHPVGFGMPREVYVFKSNSPTLELSETGHNVARFGKDSVQTSGYASKEKAQKISEAGFIEDFRIGRGRAVLFAENVTFRGFWTGLEKLLLNAILFLPQTD
ncbi:MAG TPA: M14 family metallopeptidase [Bacteroidota bacterium]|nr:M14 family metallopeptidase [Bacteroidota bacterium]